MKKIYLILLILPFCFSANAQKFIKIEDKTFNWGGKVGVNAALPIVKSLTIDNQETVSYTHLIEGVGDVMELGDTYSMRIWLNPERMAQYGLVPSDVTAVLGEQNIEAPTGSLGENSKNVFQYTMKYRGRLKSVEEFLSLIHISFFHLLDRRSRQAFVSHRDKRRTT